MKKLLLAGIIALNTNIYAQSYVKKAWDRNTTPQSLVAKSLFFTSGVGDGLAESLKFNYNNGFKRIFPNAKDDYWNPNVSWKNKYKNKDKQQGEAFPLSTTTLVGLTDGYHMARTVRNMTLMSGVTFTIGEKKKWHEYLTDMVVNTFFYSAGFNLTYESLK